MFNPHVLNPSTVSHLYLRTALPAKRVTENAEVVQVLLQSFRAIHSLSFGP
jgi:hypothetical protein